MQLQVNVTVDVPDEFIRVAEAVMRHFKGPAGSEVMAILAASSGVLAHSLALRKAAAQMLWSDLPASTED